MTEKKTPFLWSGSKDKTYKKIKNYIPKFDAYYEPFVGGGSVYFRLLAERGIFPACLSDINSDLIATYQIIRDDPVRLGLGLPKHKDRAVWDQFLNSEPNTMLDQAVRFLYLNRNRFFGMGGWMNADRYRRQHVIDRINFFSPLMRKTELSDQGCFTFQYNNPSDFVFVDPPYPETDNKSCYGMKKQDILQLNIDYLNFLCNSPANFFYIVKYNQQIQDQFKKYQDVVVEQKSWNFRKPGQKPQQAKELYVRRRATPIDLLFY